MSDLSWRHTWPEQGPDFILERARGSKPESIGRVMAAKLSRVAVIPEGWSWSLTSQARPVGMRRPGYATSGFEATQRGARDALVAAWRAEEAFRAEARASLDLGALPPYMRAYLTTGKPVPPERRPLPDNTEPA